MSARPPSKKAQLAIQLAGLKRYTFPSGPAQGTESLEGARGNYFSVSDVLTVFGLQIVDLNSARRKVP